MTIEEEHSGHRGHLLQVSQGRKKVNVAGAASVRAGGHKVLAGRLGEPG